MKSLRTALVVAFAVALSHFLGHSLAAEAVGTAYLITLTYALTVSPVFGVRASAPGGSSPAAEPLTIGNTHRRI